MPLWRADRTALRGICIGIRFQILEGPAVQNSVLDLVLAYMADMSVEDLGLVQLRYIELMNQRMDKAA